MSLSGHDVWGHIRTRDTILDSLSCCGVPRFPIVAGHEQARYEYQHDPEKGRTQDES